MARGRPKIEIDLNEVARLAGQGLTQAEICLCLRISEATLYNHKRENVEFIEAIKRGKSEAADEVSNILMELCRKGDLGAIVWFEKTRSGRSDKQTHVITTDIDWSKATDPVLDDFRAGRITIDDVRRSITG